MRTASKTGSAVQRGFAVGTLVVFSYAMIGGNKIDFCLDDADASPDNNPFFAIAKQMYSGSSSGRKTFLGK